MKELITEVRDALMNNLFWLGVAEGSSDNEGTKQEAGMAASKNMKLISRLEDTLKELP